MSLSFRAQRGIAIALKERPSIGMTERSFYMSGMSSMLRIPSSIGKSPLTTSQNEKGTAARDATLARELFPFNSRSLREEPEAAWRDVQYAAHAAHAYDPSVLDAGPTPPFWMPARLLRSGCAGGF